MEVGDAFLEDRFRGRPEDRFILEILYEVKTVRAHFSLPHAGEVRFALRRLGGGSRQVWLTVGGAGNPRRSPVEPLSMQRCREQAKHRRDHDSPHHDSSTQTRTMGAEDERIWRSANRHFLFDAR